MLEAVEHSGEEYVSHKLGSQCKLKTLLVLVLSATHVFAGFDRM